MWQVCPIADRLHTCPRPVQKPLIKMADNSLNRCTEPRVVMKFLVTKGVTHAGRRSQAQYVVQMFSRGKTFEWSECFKDLCSRMVQAYRQIFPWQGTSCIRLGLGYTWSRRVRQKIVSSSWSLFPYFIHTKVSVLFEQPSLLHHHHHVPCYISGL